MPVSIPPFIRHEDAPANDRDNPEYAILAAHINELQVKLEALDGAPTGDEWATAANALVQLNASTTSYIHDDFLSGQASSGNLGDLGWIASGGSNSAIGGELGHPGILRRRTNSAVVYAYTDMLVGTTNGVLDVADEWELTWIFRPNHVDANTYVWAGMAIAGATATSDNTIDIGFDLGDTTWHRRTRASSTATKTDTLIPAVEGAWVKFRIRKAGDTIGFRIDNEPEQFNSTNIPTGQLTPFIGIGADTAAEDKQVDIDFCSLLVTGLNR